MDSRKIVALVVVLNLLLSTGCSAFRTHSQGITVTASEENTQIWINGRYEGEAPLSLRVKRDRDLSILARKDGCEPATRHVGTHLNTTGVLDIIGTCIIILPGIGLLTPGARSLDETEITMPLFDKDKDV